MSGSTSRSTSETSSVVYPDHEPFETYRHRVVELCRVLWPSHDDADFTIERMKGGSSNRIVGIRVSDEAMPGGERRSGSLVDVEATPTSPAQPPMSDIHTSDHLPDTTSIQDDKGRGLPPSSDKPDSTPDPRPSDNLTKPKIPHDADTVKYLPSGDYVLRIPRFRAARLEADTNVVNLASRFFTANLPQTLHLDTSSGPPNPLGTPYVLQRRIPGQRLDDVWENLTHQQRLCVTRDIAKFYNEVQRAKNPSGGVPDFNPARLSPVPLGVPTTDFKFIGDANGPSVPLAPASAVKMLRARFARWRDFYGDGLRRNPTPWLVVAAVVDAMQQLNGTWEYGHEPTFFLHHGDLFPRNIMVAVDDDGVGASVTGILDWDDAHFAPAVVAFDPPAWLWVDRYWVDDSDGEEADDDTGFIGEGNLWAVAGSIPEAAEAREIKATFDDIVGDDFRKYAYCPDAVAAKKIWYAAKEPISKSWIVEELMGIMRARLTKLGLALSDPYAPRQTGGGEAGAPDPVEHVRVEVGPLSATS